MSPGASGSHMVKMSSLPRNSVVHLELHTSDAAAASTFYAQLCGWGTRSIDTTHGSYMALAIGNALGGGLVQCPIERPLWLPYTEVQDIVEATDRALELGARLLLGPREGPAGWRSVLATRTAGEIALWQTKR
jgi:predicted enzyme related to lactoylglutathione lyase